MSTPRRNNLRSYSILDESPIWALNQAKPPSGLETVNEFTERMKSATEEAKSAIRKAQEDMTQYYN